MQELKDMCVNSTVIRWFYSFLTNGKTVSEGQQNTVRRQTLQHRSATGFCCITNTVYIVHQ